MEALWPHCAHAGFMCTANAMCMSPKEKHSIVLELTPGSLFVSAFFCRLESSFIVSVIRGTKSMLEPPFIAPHYNDYSWAGRCSVAPVNTWPLSCQCKAWRSSRSYKRFCQRHICWITCMTLGKLCPVTQKIINNTKMSKHNTLPLAKTARIRADCPEYPRHTLTRAALLWGRYDNASYDKSCISCI